MLQITNVSHSPQRFRTRDGSRVEIAPGEDVTVDVDPDSSRLAAAVRAKLVTVSVVHAVRKRYVRRTKSRRTAASPETQTPAETSSDPSEE